MLILGSWKCLFLSRSNTEHCIKLWIGFKILFCWKGVFLNPGHSKYWTLKIRTFWRWPFGYSFVNSCPGMNDRPSTPTKSHLTWLSSMRTTNFENEMTPLLLGSADSLSFKSFRSSSMSSPSKVNTLRRSVQIEKMAEIIIGYPPSNPTWPIFVLTEFKIRSTHSHPSGFALKNIFGLVR